MFERPFATWLGIICTLCFVALAATAAGAGSEPATSDPTAAQSASTATQTASTAAQSAPPAAPAVRPASPNSAPSAPPTASVARPATAAPEFSEIVDRAITTLRLLLVGLAALFVRLGRPARDGSAAPLTQRQRRWALGTLAGIAIAANYNFFALPHINGFHGHDVYHYYLGSKYFPELGYYELYRCSAAAIVETHPEADPHRFNLRDLHTNVHRPAAEVLPEGPRCDGAFTAERWHDFRADVEWFAQKLGESGFAQAIRDYGYNPSPVWTLVGRTLSTAVPTEQLAILALSRLDLVLVLGSFAVAAWAFGFEGFFLAAIVWGASPLSRYGWVGDAFLRYGWLASSLMGIACLKRGRHATAGALLAFASLLRLFPALFALAYGAWGLLRWLRTRELDSGFRRFAISAIATAAVLLALAPSVAGRGFGVYAEFAQNMAAYSQEAYWNSVGLRPLLSFTSEDPPPVEVDGRLRVTEDARKVLRRETFSARWPFYWATVLVVLILTGRALGRCRDWEAAVLGFPLILVFTPPPTYYMSCAVPLAFLASARPRLVGLLFASLALWCLGNLVWYQTPREYAFASLVAMVLAVAVLLELQRSTADGDSQPVASSNSSETSRNSTVGE